MGKSQEVDQWKKSNLELIFALLPLVILQVGAPEDPLRVHQQLCRPALGVGVGGPEVHLVALVAPPGFLPLS